jgi:hypothetical protein
LLEVAGDVERNESSKFDAYIRDIAKDVENPTALLLGTSPEFTFIMSLSFCAIIISIYMLFKYIISQKEIPLIIKYVAGLGYLYFFYLIFKLSYHDFYEMLEWNFYISAFSNVMLVTFFALTIKELGQLLNIQMIIRICTRTKGLYK